MSAPSKRVCECGLAHSDHSAAMMLFCIERYRPNRPTSAPSKPDATPDPERHAFVECSGGKCLTCHHTVEGRFRCGKPASDPVHHVTNVEGNCVVFGCNSRHVSDPVHATDAVTAFVDSVRKTEAMLTPTPPEPVEKLAREIARMFSPDEVSHDEIDAAVLPLLRRFVEERDAEAEQGCLVQKRAEQAEARADAAEAERDALREDRDVLSKDRDRLRSLHYETSVRAEAETRTLRAERDEARGLLQRWVSFQGWVSFQDVPLWRETNAILAAPPAKPRPIVADPCPHGFPYMSHSCGKCEPDARPAKPKEKADAADPVDSVPAVADPPVSSPPAKPSEPQDEEAVFPDPLRCTKHLVYNCEWCRPPAQPSQPTARAECVKCGAAGEPVMDSRSMWKCPNGHLFVPTLPSFYATANAAREKSS